MTSEDQDNVVRVFFALWPGPRQRAAVAGWQASLRELCSGKPTRPDNLHATLVFVGGVPAQRLEALKLAAQEVNGRQFELAFDQARYWGHNHIVHAAPSAVPAELDRLVEDLQQSLRRHGFSFDSHSRYRPHITLLRHARWRNAALPRMQPSLWRMDHFALVQSVSGPDGVNYQVIAAFPLN